MAKTNLQKSHSVVSNFKLTMIAFLTAISFSLVFISLILIKEYKMYSIIGLCGSGLLLLLLLFLLNKFTR